MFVHSSVNVAGPLAASLPASMPASAPASALAPPLPWLPPLPASTVPPPLPGLPPLPLLPPLPWLPPLPLLPPLPWLPPLPLLPPLPPIVSSLDEHPIATIAVTAIDKNKVWPCLRTFCIEQAPCIRCREDTNQSGDCSAAHLAADLWDTAEFEEYLQPERSRLSKDKIGTVAKK